MAQYDPDILQKYADRLYVEAKFLAFAYFFIGVVFGFFGFLIIVARLSPSPGPSVESALLVALLIGFISGAHGYSKGFYKRLEAQRTLCQLQVEKNTRHVSPKSASDAEDKLFCTQCGKPANPNTAFCGNCGNRFENVAVRAGTS